MGIFLLIFTSFMSGWFAKAAFYEWDFQRKFKCTGCPAMPGQKHDPDCKIMKYFNTGV